MVCSRNIFPFEGSVVSRAPRLSPRRWSPPREFERLQLCDHEDWLEAKILFYGRPVALLGRLAGAVLVLCAAMLLPHMPGRSSASLVYAALPKCIWARTPGSTCSHFLLHPLLSR